MKVPVKFCSTTLSYDLSPAEEHLGGGEIARVSIFSNNAKESYGSVLVF